MMVKIARETMRFILIDKVVSLDPGRHIKTVKGVSLAEEYLADHFPTFPVLPGVLLLQGLVESASWLVRKTQDFAHSMVLLEQTRNVKYKSFLAPGMQITYTVDAKALDDKISSFTGYGDANGQRIVEARLTLRHFNLAEKNKGLAEADTEIIDALQRRWRLLRPSNGKK
jgi:3-hydroxyacyl-[acyl-carrier-protein] dehydratase